MKRLNVEILDEHLSHIGEAVIGEGSRIHSHVWIGDQVTIGQAAKIQAFCFIPDGVTIGDYVFLGPRVTFTNDMHPPSYGTAWASTHVEDCVSIGAGVTILPGVRIGKHARIGAGSVVTKDVPPNEVWVGNPARKLK